MHPMTTLREALAERIAAVAEAESAREALGGLLEGLRLFAPRAAIFLVRRDEVCGWNNAGYAETVAGSLRRLRSPLGRGWLGELAAAREGGPFPCPPQADPASTTDESVGLTIRVSGTPLAVLTIERSAGDEPWNPAAATLLATVVRLRLELILAARKMESLAAAGAQASPSAARPQTETEVPGAQAPPPARPVVKGDGDSPELLAARRFARLVATDIRLYNEEAVLQGRRHRDLIERLADPMNRGKESFRERHAGLGEPGLALLRQAFVEVLGGGDETLLPASYFEA